MFAKKTSFSTFLFTFIGGLVTGGLLALFFTPMTGKKLQKKVVDKVEDLQEVVRRIAVA